MQYSADRSIHLPAAANATPKHWRWERLDEVCEGVFDCPHSTPLLTDDGPFVVRSQDVRSGIFRMEGAGRVSDETYQERITRAEPRHGDLVYSREGTYFGIAAELPPGVRVCLGQRMVLLRPNDSKANFRFLRYWLNSPVMAGHIHGYRDGTVAERLNMPIIRGLPVALPPLSEQRAIASVLGSLDDKIELNRRMNETLEALAQSLFKSWFVDFDPIRAKGGHFQDSPIGPIPKGWNVERFDKHITADRGLSYKGEGLRDDGTGLPMHNLNSVYEGGGYKHEGIKYYAGEYREKHLLQPGDMIVTNTEQGFDHLLIGHAAIVPKCYGPQGLFSHHLYRVRHKPTSPFSPHYLVELFNNRRWHYWISGFSNGTTINMLPKDALEMPLLVVPPDELVKKFTALAEAVHTKVEANLEESRTLAALRDSLLPKLLSGELRVPLSNNDHWIDYEPDKSTPD